MSILINVSNNLIRDKQRTTLGVKGNWLRKLEHRKRINFFAFEQITQEEKRTDLGTKWFYLWWAEGGYPYYIYTQEFVKSFQLLPKEREQKFSVSEFIFLIVCSDESWRQFLRPSSTDFRLCKIFRGRNQIFSLKIKFANKFYGF